MQRSNSPLPGHDAQSNAGVCQGGVLKFRIDRGIILERSSTFGKLWQILEQLLKQNRDQKLETITHTT